MIMKLWIARDKNGLFSYTKKPTFFEGLKEFGCMMGEEFWELPSNWFPEVTFENSPQEVEIVLPKTYNKVWHDIDEEPIYENGVTPIIIDSNYGHISQEGHYYNQVQWKSHIEFQKHREFKWAYEKDLMNL